MIDFQKRETVHVLEAEVDDFTITCAENRKWDRKTRKFVKDTDWRVTIELTDDENHSSIDLAVASEEEAKVVAEQALKFLQSVRPALLFDKYKPRTED